MRFLCSRRYTGVFDDEEVSVGHDGTMGRRSYVDDSKLINRRSWCIHSVRGCQPRTTQHSDPTMRQVLIKSMAVLLPQGHGVTRAVRLAFRRQSLVGIIDQSDMLHGSNVDQFRQNTYTVAVVVSKDLGG